MGGGGGISKRSWVLAKSVTSDLIFLMPVVVIIWNWTGPGSGGSGKTDESGSLDQELEISGVLRESHYQRRN